MGNSSFFCTPSGWLQGMQGNSVWRCGELSEAHAGQRHGIRSIRTNLLRAHAQYSTPMGVQSGALASLTRNGRKRRPSSRSIFLFLEKNKNKRLKEAQTRRQVCAHNAAMPLVYKVQSSGGVCIKPKCKCSPWAGSGLGSGVLVPSS